MKYLVVMLLVLSFNAKASDVLDNYYKENLSKKDYRDIKAKQRASIHPKGSGVGTTRYNIKYTRDYKVNRFRRKD